MSNSSMNVSRIDEQILTIDKHIYKSIEKMDISERGYFSQSILAQLRNFVEHIMLKIYADGQDIENTYPNIQEAIVFVKKMGHLKFLWKFHKSLQVTESHYTSKEEGSERLMLSYYGYLLKIREFLKDNYSFGVLENIDNFPINIESDLVEYYEKIAARIEDYRSVRKIEYDDRFYIQKIKQFFINKKIYYEVTFSPINGNKFDRIIAFTDQEIPNYYTTKLFVAVESIKIFDKTMPIHIIVEWKTSVRPCEIRKFSALFGANLKPSSNSAEYAGLMDYLTQTSLNLVEILDFGDNDYFDIRKQILSNARVSHFFVILDKCRNMMKNRQKGSNVLRYLLYHLDDRVIKNQKDYWGRANSNLSGLFVGYGCISFDEMPFCTSLMSHIPKLGDLFDCIDSSDRTHELFARRIKNNAEQKGHLYTSVKDLIQFENIDFLIKKHNDQIYWKHMDRELKRRHDYIFISGYEREAVYILNRLVNLANKNLPDYSDNVRDWIESKDYIIDSKEKEIALTQMFEGSKVAIIRGPAGTGKTTMINHISNYFLDEKKLFLANTNPAVDNLKRRVVTNNSTHLTIAKFLKSRRVDVEYDLLIIDECSTVSNNDMVNILYKARFNLLILVGDIYQIESIQFGNWFNLAQKFISKASVTELNITYRSENQNLLELWERVRHMDGLITDHVVKHGYSGILDRSIFEKEENDEIILCLNYGGLYGINNINRFLQQSNTSDAVRWGIQEYKVNDPILFTESDRFGPLIYNNMKGTIMEIYRSDDRITFDIELEREIEESYAFENDFEILDNSQPGRSKIRISINKFRDVDEDDEANPSTIVPFQVAYAVSIHKAQGLEYDSVKIVITDEIDELITHNIFYTAITRARNKLKIYWTPEVENRVLSRITPRDNNQDAWLLKPLLE